MSLMFVEDDIFIFEKNKIKKDMTMQKHRSFG
jgi:hypothetical protein